jgi:hypothetical protein
MSELTPKPDSTGGENKKKKKCSKHQRYNIFEVFRVKYQPQ